VAACNVSRSRSPSCWKELDAGRPVLADLFSFRGEVRPATPNQLAFAEQLEELELDFDRVVPVHTGLPRRHA
jgi:hypothetical protein